MNLGLRNVAGAIRPRRIIVRAKSPAGCPARLLETPHPAHTRQPYRKLCVSWNTKGLS